MLILKKFTSFNFLIPKECPALRFVPDHIECKGVTCYFPFDPAIFSCVKVTDPGGKPQVRKINERTVGEIAPCGYFIDLVFIEAFMNDFKMIIAKDELFGACFWMIWQVDPMTFNFLFRGRK